MLMNTSQYWYLNACNCIDYPVAYVVPGCCFFNFPEIAEKRKIQADLYEKVVRGEDDIELSFQKYRDLLNEHIIVGMYMCSI